MAHATIGARRNLTRRAILPFRPPGPSAPRGEPAPRRAASTPADVPAPGHRVAQSRRPGRRSSSRARTGSRRNAAHSSRGRGHPAEDAVDEPPGIFAGEGLGQLDRLVDGGLRRHLPVDRDLVDRDAQDDAVHLRHLLEPPVLGGLAQDRVEAVPIVDHAVDQLARKVGDVIRRGALGGVVEENLLGVVSCAFELKEDLERQLPCLVALTGHYVAKATLETKTFTSPTSRPSIRSVASTTLAWTAAAASASFASESTVMKTSRWIERSPSMCTRTPRCAAWRRTQSPKWRAAASSIPSTPSTSQAARAAMLAITSLATRTAPSEPFSLITALPYAPGPPAWDKPLYSDSRDHPGVTPVRRRCDRACPPGSRRPTG